MGVIFNMNSLNHVLIGTIVYEYIKEKYGIVLDKESFLKGNTCPDHSIAFLRPHRMRYCSRMVRKKTIRLCRRDWGYINEKASKKIGILCHYYSDFFCYAHCSCFPGSLKDHIRYEDEMLRYMNERYSIFQKIDYVPQVTFPMDAAEINERMRQLIWSKASMHGNYGMELICAIQACTELVLAVSYAILFSQEESSVPAYRTA